MSSYSTPLTDVHVERATKSGTRWRHKSIICDGDFLNDLKTGGFFVPVVPDVSRVVVALPPVSLPCTHPESFKPKRKQWRDTGEEINGLFFHKALEIEPSVKGFTLMLTRPVEALARAQGKAARATECHWRNVLVGGQARPRSRLRLGEGRRGDSFRFRRGCIHRDGRSRSLEGRVA